MKRLRPYPFAVFGALTTFIWVTRVPLAWETTDGGIADKALPLGTAVAFLVPSVVLLVSMLAAKPSGRVVILARGLAAWTVLYWAVRLPLILLHDHPVAFKVVHAVLAAVSVGTAIVAWRAAHRPVRSETERPAPDTVLA